MSIRNPAYNTATGGCGTTSTDTWRNWKPDIIKAPDLNLLFQSVLLLCYWRMLLLQKVLNFRMGSYFIYFL